MRGQFRVLKIEQKTAYLYHLRNECVDDWLRSALKALCDSISEALVLVLFCVAIWLLWHMSAWENLVVVGCARSLAVTARTSVEALAWGPYG